MATCDWDISVSDCCNDLDLDFEAEAVQVAVDSAISQVSDMLSRWSGYAFGGCKTLRPLDPCGECRAGCCSNGDALILHDASSVLKVRVDGEVLDDSEWDFDASRGLLYRELGERWPNSDPRVAGEPPAVEVDVRIGAEPDAWAKAVATELACELVRSCMGGKCRLPENATQVTSQGITITLDYDTLKFSLPSVIAWVSAVNPARATRPARISSPEARSARRGIGGIRRPWR